jgi:argininosuccinate synthase
VNGSNTVVLAYSGGLDTSIVVPWLKENYGLDVVCFAADVGQAEELDGLEAKALASGAVACYVEDLREEFLEGFVWPTLRAGAVYGRKYLLGTSMARPIIARYQVELARRLGAGWLAHGCTGKGNDQVRFELTYAALAPDLGVIAPWREWDIRSREDALAYAASRGIPVTATREKIFSRDRNLWHVSHEGGPLEDPDWSPTEDVFLLTRSPESAPSRPRDVAVTFEGGNPVAVDGERLDPVPLLTRLNAIAGEYGVGRIDIVEDRLVGMKSRGIYETPGGTLLYAAHSDLEQLVLDRRTLELKDQLAGRYASLVYDGRWWSLEREALDALVDRTQAAVTGTVRLRLAHGTCTVVGRTSPNSAYDEAFVTFGEDDVYDQADAGGFIRLYGLPLRVAALQRMAREAGDPEAAVDHGRTGEPAPAGPSSNGARPSSAEPAGMADAPAAEPIPLPATHGVGR